MVYKKSFILLEVIFSIVLLSVIFSIATKFILDINKKNINNYTTNLTKLEFETTKLFMINTLNNDNNLNKIVFKDNNIYYDNNLLQSKVNKFNISTNNDIYTIDICIDLYTNICQTWIIHGN